MKLEPVTKLSKRNKTTSKMFDNKVILINCDAIVVVLIYDHLEQPEVVFWTHILQNLHFHFSKLSSWKNCKQN